MQHKVTVFQRAFMLTLHAAQRDIDTLTAGSEHRPICFLCRRAVEFALWFDWQTHHTNKVNELIEMRWVRYMSVSGIVYYALTDHALTVLDNNWQGVERHRHVQWAGEMPQDMLPGFDSVPF